MEQGGVCLLGSKGQISLPIISWLNAYSITKPFSFSSTFVERFIFRLAGALVFNSIPPTP